MVPMDENGPDGVDQGDEVEGMNEMDVSKGAGWIADANCHSHQPSRVPDASPKLNAKCRRSSGRGRQLHPFGLLPFLSFDFVAHSKLLSQTSYLTRNPSVSCPTNGWS